MEAPTQQHEALQDATNGFATSRMLALREVLGGRPSQATRVLLETIRGVLDNLAEVHASSSGQQGSKRRRLGPTSASAGFGRLIQQLSQSPPELIAQNTGSEFVHSEWRAAIELLLVSLACTQEAAAPALTVGQAEAVARYLDAFDAVDAVDAEHAVDFRHKYGGSAGLPDFAVAVMTIKSGGETIEAFRAAMPSLRCCLRAEPDFPLGLFLMGLCYDRIGDEPIRAAQLFRAAFASADALPRGILPAGTATEAIVLIDDQCLLLYMMHEGLRPGPALLMAGVAHARRHGNSNAGGMENSWRAIQHFQDVLRRDAGQEQDGQPAEFNAALYNVAALWASESAGPSHAESTWHRDAMALLVESFDASASSNACAFPNAPSASGNTVGAQMLLAPENGIDRLGQREVEHMAARAALRCADWTAASDAYAKLLDTWPEFASEQRSMGASDRDRAGVACINCIHREYCLALLRAAECSSLGASVQLTSNDSAGGDGGTCNRHNDAIRKRCTAVALCEHVLKYRPHDVMLLLLLSEAQYELEHFAQALRAVRVASQTLELLRSQELLSCCQDKEEEKDTSVQSVNENFLATLAACGLDCCNTERKSRPALQLESLLAESYHHTAAVLWRLGRHDEAIDSHFLADRCLPVRTTEAHAVGAQDPLSASTAGAAELHDRVIFSLTLALWARGRCQEAAERWAVYRGWSSASAASSDSQSDNANVHRRQTFSQKQRALQGQLISTGASENNKRQQQRFIMDRLVLAQLLH